MSPETLITLRNKVRDLNNFAASSEGAACNYEEQAAEQRRSANNNRRVAQEIQALIDAATGAQPQTETPAVGDRTVQHVDTDTQDEEPAGVLPPHVWLYRNMLTDLQRAAPLGIDSTNGQYAVAIDDLTPEQWGVPHIAQQIAAMPESNVQSDAS